MPASQSRILVLYIGGTIGMAESGEGYVPGTGTLQALMEIGVAKGRGVQAAVFLSRGGGHGHGVRRSLARNDALPRFFWVASHTPTQNTQRLAE